MKTYSTKFLIVCSMGLIVGLILGEIYVLFSSHSL